MSNENVELIRRAYEAYSRGDVATMLRFVDPDLEWTYLDPSLEDPDPQVCHGRHELETALERQAERGLEAELEEVTARGDRVMVVVRTPGIDGYRIWKADDRNYAVFTVREGRIVALRDCRDRGKRWRRPTSNRSNRFEQVKQRVVLKEASPDHPPRNDATRNRSLGDIEAGL
jgi:ketosteroid isomerase-like protein